MIQAINTHNDINLLVTKEEVEVVVLFEKDPVKIPPNTILVKNGARTWRTKGSIKGTPPKQSVFQIIGTREPMSKFHFVLFEQELIEKYNPLHQLMTPTEYWTKMHLNQYWILGLEPRFYCHLFACQYMYPKNDQGRFILNDMNFNYREKMDADIRALYADKIVSMISLSKRHEPYTETELLIIN